MAYFETKSGSLEESIRKAVGEKLVGGQKKLDKDKDGDIDGKDFAMLRKDAKKKKDEAYKPVKANHYDVKVTVSDKDVRAVKAYIMNSRPYNDGDIEDVDSDQVDGGGMKFKGTGDIFIQGDGAGKLGMEIAKKFRGVKVMGEEVELDEGKMKQVKSLIDDIANAMKKDKMMKSFADKFVKDAQKTLDPRKSLEKVLPDYVPGKDIAKLLNMGENYDIGTPENTMAKLDATPGQSQDDWQRQVDTMQKKNASMREALAKIWGMGEGHNPFKTEGGHLPSEKKKKDEDKTMTGKPMTKVNIDPDMKEVKVGKKNVR